MAVDGQEPATLRDMLNTEIEYIQMRHEQGAAIFTTLAAYAPAMGMIGTLIGLVQMLQNMSDPMANGPAMAVAFITVFLWYNYRQRGVSSHVGIIGRTLCCGSSRQDADF